jgi:carboxymethylenebutenolidase
MATDSITIKTADGLDFDAYVARPKTGGSHPVVVVIQEIFGVNKFVRDVADMLAQQGYIAVAPDLFHRLQKGVQLTDQTEAEWKRAFELMNAFDEKKGIEDLTDTVRAARDMEGASGKVGSVGFCLGGRLAYLMATRSEADCCVGYYGIGLENNLDETIKHPLLLHVAEEDEYCDKDAQAKIKAALGNNSKVELYFYAGQNHAFSRTGGKHYNKEAADLAHRRTAEFFKKHIG